VRSYSRMECAVLWKAPPFHCVQFSDKGLLTSIKIMYKERMLKFGKVVCVSVEVEICVIMKVQLVICTNKNSATGMQHMCFYIISEIFL